MGRSQETFNKKNVRNKKEKKRKAKEEKRIARKEAEKKSSLDDMIAYVDEHGRITSSPPKEDKKKIKAEDIELGVPGKSNEDEYRIRRGVVSFFNDSKGYGFVKDLETKQNYFFHINDTVDEIGNGNLVTFEIGTGQKGPVAMGIQKYIPENNDNNTSE